MELRGKKVVITGSGKRIGRALAECFADKGARLTLHCRNSQTEAEGLLERLGGVRAGHELFIGDLSDPGFLENTAPEMLRNASLLINNASVFIRRKMLEETPQEMEAQMSVNCTGPVRLMQLFAKYGKRPGVIVNMLDQGICRPDENSFSYALSKKTLAEATRSAALHLAPEIRVNGIAPGPVLPPPELPFSKMEQTLRSVPLGKPVALQDLCAGAVFLAENDSVTGTVLFIDCGQSLCQIPRPL